jgi:hypothetical protein
MIGSRKIRTARLLLGVLAACTVGTTAQAAAGGRPAAFAWLVPTAAPSTWKHVRLPSGLAVLSYPSTLQRSSADPGSITAESRNSQGLLTIYLNVTPKQGNEGLANWPSYRLHVNSERASAPAHEDAAVTNVPFLGGTGSCVIDDYVTRGVTRHYKEIACYVEGPHGGSVIIATTMASLWAQQRRALEQTIAAYRVT